MKKCFEIDQDGNVHQGIRVSPHIVVGGKGIGNAIGIFPIYKPNDDEKNIQYFDSNNRVYGLWINHDNDEPYAEFNKIHTSPDGFGTARAIVAFRTHNRCIEIDAYTGETETITCRDCRWRYVGKPREMPRLCHRCDGKVKSTFKPFPGNVLAQGDASDDGDAQVGKEIVATLPIGYVFRIALTKDEGKNPIECYYQFNGGDIDSLGMFQEDKHGYIKESKTT